MTQIESAPTKKHFHPNVNSQEPVIIELHQLSCHDLKPFDCNGRNVNASLASSLPRRRGAIKSVLKAGDQKLTGTVTIGQGKEHEISSGKVEGDSTTF